MLKKKYAFKCSLKNTILLFSKIKCTTDPNQNSLNIISHILRNQDTIIIVNNLFRYFKREIHFNYCYNNII